MRILNKTDHLEVMLKSLIADYDYETVVNLYQPLIGYKASSVYFTFLNIGKTKSKNHDLTHEDFLSLMQMNSGDFVDARKVLEAVGLIKTFYLKDEENTFYHYEIYSPKTPESFFDNALLYGMLIEYLGEERASEIKANYNLPEQKNLGEDISSKFSDVYHDILNNNSIKKAIIKSKKPLGRASLKVDGSFSFEEFFNSLKAISKYKESDFSKKEMKELSRLATLYSINESKASEYILESINEKKEYGERIDFSNLKELFLNDIDISVNLKTNSMNKVKNLNSGLNDLANKINLMEIVSPKKFLSLLQNGTQPAISDLRLIDDLSKRFQLNNSVINSIIDYTLSNCNNILSRAYAEKIAASIAREGVETTIDAMNYLTRCSKKKKATKTIKSSVRVLETAPKKITKKEDIDEECSWDDLLDDLEEVDSDGKA